MFQIAIRYTMIWNYAEYELVLLILYKFNTKFNFTYRYY